MENKTFRSKVATALIGALLATCCLAALPVGNRTDRTSNAEQDSPAVASAAKTFILAVGKGRAADPEQQQQRAIDAVRRVTEAAQQCQRELVVETLAENVMTKKQFMRREVEVQVTGAIFREQLRRLAKTATSRDTVIIYTHTHGTKANDERQTPAGLVLDPGPKRPGEHAVFSWEQYADLLLEIPAKNVVVLTMSCYSGGLIERLNSPEVRRRWENRKREGRNLVVLTSQNKELMSPPIVKQRELINPFTYAVSAAFAGQADGFTLVDGKADNAGPKDGRLTVGELIDYVLHTTEQTKSDAPQRPNIAQPQLTGSFDRDAVLLVGES